MSFNVKSTRGTIPPPLPPHFIFTTCLLLIAIQVYEERSPCQNKDFGENVGLYNRYYTF